MLAKSTNRSNSALATASINTGSHGVKVLKGFADRHRRENIIPILGSPRNWTIERCNVQIHSTHAPVDRAFRFLEHGHFLLTCGAHHARRSGRPDPTMDVRNVLRRNSSINDDCLRRGEGCGGEGHEVIRWITTSSDRRNKFVDAT